MSKRNEIIANVEIYIDKYGNKRLTAKEIANNFNIHPSNLNRLFHRSNNLTLKQHLDNKLRNVIVQYMCTNDVDGYRITTEFGFSSVSAFYRWVKRIFGITFVKLSTQYQNKTENSPSN